MVLPSELLQIEPALHHHGTALPYLYFLMSAPNDRHFSNFFVDFFENFFVNFFEKRCYWFDIGEGFGCDDIARLLPPLLRLLRAVS